MKGVTHGFARPPSLSIVCMFGTEKPAIRPKELTGKTSACILQPVTRLRRIVVEI